MKNSKKYIAYIRVSTKKQGNSGLGVDAQRKIIKEFAKDDEIISEFVEIASASKRQMRVELEKAIDLSKKENATILIARLDRISRNLVFVNMLLDSNVDFVCADFPNIDKSHMYTLALMAEHQSKSISESTKNALSILKQRGVTLGHPVNFSEKGRKRGAETNKQKASSNQNNQRSTAMICMLRNTENISFKKIADRLNSNGFVTANNNPHTATSVRNLYLRSLK